MLIERMATELKLPLRYVERIAVTASYQYKQYTIPKRAGGHRTIFHPSRKLKALQRWLLVEVVGKWPVHPAAFAYRSGISIFDHAKLHAASKYLLRMDMKEFFPSIKSDDLERYMAAHPTLFDQWTDRDRDWFSHLIFRNGSLTIGAPTSPAVSNALCINLDSALAGISSGYAVLYSRYADDLFFSSTQKGVLPLIETQVATTIAALETPAKLQLNNAKTKRSSKRGARRVTGIVLGSDGQPHVSRETKRSIRTLVYSVDTLTGPERVRLAGMISYVTGFEPNFMNSLILKYGPEKVERARLAK